MLTHFMAIKSVKSAQRGNKIGKKIDPGQTRPGKQIGRLEVYTPPFSLVRIVTAVERSCHEIGT